MARDHASIRRNTFAGPLRLASLGTSPRRGEEVEATARPPGRHVALTSTAGIAISCVMSDPFELTDETAPENAPAPAAPRGAVVPTTAHLEGLNETQREAVEH